ncbi:hypothetical protein TWF281_004473 [Arthrobotrys megalospora]
MEYTAQSQPAVPARTHRAYRKLKDIEVHKDFVLQRHQAGIRQKDIRAALKRETGIDLEPYNLKRILNKWGVSHKSLTKRRKLYIRRIVDERRRGGKRDPRVRLGRSNRVLNDEEVNEIMNLQLDYFKDTKPSPGDIEFSSPTPAADSTGDETDLSQGTLSNRESPYTNRDSSQTMDIESDNNGIHIDDPVQEETTGNEEEEPLLPAQTIYELIGGGVSRSEYTIEELQEAIVTGIKALGLRDNQEVDIIDEDVLGDITEVAGIQDKPWHEVPQVHANDWSSPLLREYARMYEDVYRDWVDYWKTLANEKLLEFQEFLELGMSYEEASRRVSVECERQDQFFLTYKACTNILRPRTDAPNHEPERECEKDKGKAILSYVDNVFSILETTCPWEYFLGPQAAYIYGIDDFRKFVVHLPRIIQEHGYQSFFTALCLQGTLETLIEFDWNLCWDLRAPGFGARDLVSPLAENSILIFDAVGMGCEPLAWTQYYVRLTECQERDRLLQRLRRRYGGSHPFTLGIEIQILNWMTRDGGFLDPVRRKHIETLLSKFVHKLMRVHLSVGSYHVSDLFAMLPGFILWFDVPTAMIFAKILQRYISGAEFRQDAQTRSGKSVLSHCTFALGVAYSTAEKFTLSLATLIRAYGMFNQQLRPAFAALSLTLMCQVADARGPILYASLDPVFADARARFAKVGSSNGFIRRTLSPYIYKHRAYRMSRLGKEYSNMLALRPLKRSSTPDLQQYLYYQSLESWMYSEGVCDIPDDMDMDLGGHVMECSEAELGTEMQMDTMSVEEELGMIIQRYRQAEAAGLIDENGKFISS